MVVIEAGLADSFRDYSGWNEPAPRNRESVEIQTQSGNILHVSLVVSERIAGFIACGPIFYISCLGLLIVVCFTKILHKQKLVKNGRLIYSDA